MKIYNEDVNWRKGSIFFNVNVFFMYSAYVQQALSFISRAVFSVNLRIVECIF